MQNIQIRYRQYNQGAYNGKTYFAVSGGTWTYFILIQKSMLSLKPIQSDLKMLLDLYWNDNLYIISNDESDIKGIGHECYTSFVYVKKYQNIQNI